MSSRISTKKRDEVRKIMQETWNLPTLPGIIVKLTSLVDHDRATVSEMARVISSDNTLAAKVLRLVNSPFYGFSGRISTVSKALMFLGVNIVKSIALSSSIIELMERNTIGLWEHSFGCAVAANTIARSLGIDEPEEISTAALLHDIGKVIIKLKMEEDYNNILSFVRDEEISMLDAERKILDTDHAEVGGWIAKVWCLPEKLAEPIACHHDIARSVTHQTKTAVVHLANILVRASGFGFGGDDFVPPIQEGAWKKLGLHEYVLENIVQTIEDKFIEAKNFSLEVQR